MEIRNKDSPIVYICSPYSGDVTHNIEMHLWLPLFISEEEERELAMSAGLRLMDKCSELWVCGDRISDGMRREMAYAADNGILIRHVKEEEINVCN